MAVNGFDKNSVCAYVGPYNPYVSSTVINFWFSGGG